MDNLYKYNLIGLIIILLFISFKYYMLSDDYDELNIEYKEILAKYAVEQSNTVLLENSIKEQNLLIETYKKSSEEYSKKIESLNEEIVELNKTELSYENSNNESATSEEAIQWLKEKASSLSY